MLDWFKRGGAPNSNAGIFEPYRILPEPSRREAGPPAIGC